MVIDFYNRNGGGGSADYATSAGTASVSNSTKLLEGGSALPQSAETGDVVAVAPAPALLSTRGTKGLRSANPTLGIYQYDGSNWNKIEGGGGSSAYKIELSTNNPEDFTEDDIANLNAFFGAVEADPSIADGAYVYYDSQYYRCTYAELNEENHQGYFTFVISGPTYIESTNINFEIGEYSDGMLYRWEGNYILPFNEFPADPVEGQIANYNDGNGNIGLYRFDGEDWQPYGGGGDNTILKAVSGVPATIENGDVFAIHTPSADTQYEVSAWTNTEEYTISFDHPVQAIKVHIKTNGHFDFGFNDADWHDGLGFDIDADLDYGYVFNCGNYDSTRWEVSEQTVKFIAPEWMAKTDGKTLYLVIREDNGDYYLYIYTEDVELIWITDVAQNTIDGEIQEGTVAPAHDAYDKAYQYSGGEGAELAKVTDLPAENRLVPKFNKDEDSSKVLFIDYWSTNGLVWQSQNDLVRNVFATYEGLGGGTGKALIQKDGYTFEWKHIDKIYPISLLPVQAQKGVSFTTEDGIFHAGDEVLDNTNLYEIENHNDWDNPTGGTQLVISGSNTSNRVGFKFEGYGDDFMLIWNGSEWSTEWLENVTQENGNLTGYTTGTPIEIVVAYDSTNDVFEVTCGEPWAGLYAGNDEGNHSSQYFVSNLPVTKYSKSVMSNSINSIVKLTQADYDALVSGGTVDANTFYVIISPNS